ncbi:MAG: FecR family protein [Candidatus Eremiobacteraeota bacterium]|nr:FecR family protein [Candidatus Eremiobacteraeota bacterium]
MAILAVAAALAAPAIVSADTANKELQSVKGDVSYQRGTVKKSLAISASIVLADKDYAITGADSRGAVGLPDSSVVTVGSDTKVQLAFFNRTGITSARFVVFNGKTRFEVRHPAGAKANYTFVTPTATIGVRGTQGDIGVQGDSLQVNVYELCDPASPVIVTAKNGRQFTVNADQAFAGRIVNGIFQAQVEQLTQTMLDQFSGDLGNLPLSLADLESRAQSQLSGTVAGATSGISGAGEIAGAIGSLFKKKSTPSPAPSQSATCS